MKKRGWTLVDWEYSIQNISGNKLNNCGHFDSIYSLVSKSIKTHIRYFTYVETLKNGCRPNTSGLLKFWDTGKELGGSRGRELGHWFQENQELIIAALVFRFSLNPLQSPFNPPPLFQGKFRGQRRGRRRKCREIKKEKIYIYLYCNRGKEEQRRKS